MYQQFKVRVFAVISILSMLLSAVGVPTHNVWAAPKDTALQFDGTNDYVTFGNTRMTPGTLTGTPTWNTQANSKLGASSLTFNGTSQYVTFGAAPDLTATNFTIETWFYWTGAGATASTGTGGITAIPLVTKGRGESETTGLNVNYFLGIAGGKLSADFEAYAGGQNYPVTGTTTVTTNAWHHAAATYNGTCWQLYLDGVADTSGTTCPGVAPDYSSTQHAGIATAMTSTGAVQGYFAGRMDEVRIWNVARSEAEIQASMNSEILVPASGLIGRWGLNDASGTTASNLNKLGVTAFTLEAWVKRAAGGASMSTGTGGLEGTGGRPQAYPVLAKGMGEGETPANVNTNWFLGITTTGVVGADFEDTAGGVNHPAWGTTSIPVDGTWHHIAATYTGSCWALYVDGNPDPLDAAAELCPNATPESTSYQRAGLSAGINSTGGLGTGYFSGVIDEARIWNRALDASEILANKDLELTSGTGLVARWGLNEAAGTTINSSVGTFPGTLTNGPVWVITDTTPPAAPVGLSATASDGQIALSWTANSEPDLAGYKLYRSSTSPVPTGGTPINGVSLITGTSYNDLCPPADTLYYYALVAVDTSGNPSSPSAEASATAIGGCGLQFDGTNDYVTFGASSGLGVINFTLETWFYWTGGGTAMTTSGTQGLPSVIPLISKGRGEADGSNVDMNYFLGIDTNTGALAADFEDMASGMNYPVIATTPVSINTWHHAAVTYDSVTGVYNFYLDGVLDKTSDIGNNVLPRSDSIQHAGLASAMTSAGTPAGYFQGKLDEARIWNYARMLPEIRSTVNSQVTSGTGLVARWGMGEGSGLTIASSVGSFPGTLMNGPTFVAGAPFNLVFETIPPAAPTNLMASPRPGAVQLEWTANTEMDLAGYRIYRSTTSPVVKGTPINGTLTSPSYLDSSVTAGITYYYAVTAVDTSGNESDLSNETSAVPLPPPPAEALDFGSGSAYVTFGDPASLDLAQFTIETWFKRTGAGTVSTTGTSGVTNALPLVTHGAPEADGSNVDANWVLVIDDTNDVIAADFEDMATGLNHPVYGTTPLANDTWYHAAATFDGTTWRLYLNGNLETTLVTGAVPRSDTTQHAGLGTMIDSDGTSTNGHFQGALDEVRVWNYARSQAQIVSTINTKMPAPQTGLVARWGLDEATGSVVNDSSGNNLTGAVNGTGYSWVPGSPFNATVNLPPAMPTVVSPANGASNVPIPASLSVTVTDPENSPLNVTFYGRPMQSAAGPDFTIIAIPDPQYYAATYPSIYNAQMQWVVDNKTTENIAFVASLGDNVDVASNMTQWTNADTAWDILDPAGVPYGLTAGNHDSAPSGTANFNTYFGESRFAAKPWYGGHYGSDNDNHYALFSASGLDFIVVFIEYDSTMTSTGHPVLTWANGLLQTYNTRRAIVVSHNMLDGNNFSTQGGVIYNALKANPNLFLMLGGHLDVAGQRSDIYNGKTVYILRSDYQTVDSQQSGYLRIMRFSPANDMIYVTTYSPTQNKFYDKSDAAQNNFNLIYPMDGVGFDVIGTVNNVASGGTATINWDGLDPDAQYEWFAIASDGTHQTESATWNFTAGSGTTATDATSADFSAGTLGDCVVDNTVGDGALKLNIPASISCVFTSRIHDAGALVDWTTLTSTATLPAGTSISFEARSGNSASPDATWTNWQSANGTLTNPGSQYIQYRATLSTTDSGQTPVLEDVTINFVTGTISNLISPDGTLTSWNGSFTWTGVDGATWYLLEVFTPSGTQLYRKWYTSTQTGCATGTACSLTPTDLSLPNGSYQWRIMDYGAYGYGIWTYFKSFTLSAACHQLTLAVNPALSGTVTAPAQTCAGGYLSGTLVQLNAVPGTGYRFTDWSGSVTGTTNPISFTMDGDKTITANMRGNTPLTPAGTLDNWNYTFTWTGLSDATWYLIEVQTSGGTQVYRKWFTSAQSNCVGGTACSAAPTDLSLPNGDYKWRVLDYGAYGYGLNSAFKAFRLNLACYTLTVNVNPVGSGNVTAPAQTCSGGFTAGTVIQLNAVPNTGYLFDVWSGDVGGSTNPLSVTMSGDRTITANFKGTVLPLTPGGTLTSWDKTFTWTGVSNATWYLIEVQSAGGTQVFRKWYTSAQANCAGGTSCSVTALELSLTNGDYKWRVLDYGAYGYGVNSAFKTFTLNIPIVCTNVIYVDVTSTAAAPDGCSWGTAYKTLQDGLSAATSGKQIWVADGTYYPDRGGGNTLGNRNASFALKDGVAVYGGFKGNETSLTARDKNPATNGTVLSGDIGTVNVIADNTYQVVRGDGVSASAVLDGFTITRGNSNGSSGHGGGMYLTGSSPTLANLLISNNTANSNGGGVYIVTVGQTVEVNYTRPSFTDVTFISNTAARGGGMFTLNSSPSLTRVVFSNNTASGGAGGGMNNQVANGATDARSIPVMIDVTFSGNTANGGGGLYNNYSNSILNRVTFAGNTANRRGGGVLNEVADPSFTNVTFYGNVSLENTGVTPWGGGGMMNVTSNPTLNHVTFSGNNSVNGSGTAGGDAMRNATNSNPVVRNSIFWGDLNDEITSDGTGTMTISYSVVQGGFVGGTNIVTTDPKLLLLANNGGFTQTMALGAGSSAVDVGNNSTCAAGDQRGVTRPQGLVCDAGAYELDVVLLIAPSGTLASWNDTFSWTGQSDATWYLLEVYTSGGTQVFRKWYTSPQTGCSGGVACSVVPPETAGLAPGAYKWRILDYGAYGYGTWTPYLNFTLP